jgi:hypothetical protein
MDQRALFLASTALAVALALFGIFAPLRWHEMPDWVINLALLLALFLFLLAVLIAVPSRAKGAKKLLAALLISAGACALISGIVLYLDGQPRPKPGDSRKAAWVEVASARLIYDGSDFKVISVSNAIKNENIERTTGILYAQQPFLFQFGFSGGQGPFDVEMSIRNDSFFGILGNNWMPVDSLTILENTDNFVEFQLEPFMAFLALTTAVSRSGPITVRISFRAKAS